MGRATHLWSPDAPMGQVQNQAYGYFFPHGSFFALGELIGLPGWVTQRLWWAALLTVGVIGLVRLAEALRIGSYWSRLFAGVLFVAAPRVLTTMGSISSETLPYVLAPWVLVPLVRALDAADPDPRPLWQSALRSACAVALMGAVNAVATLAATAVALLWWGFGLLVRDHNDLRRRLTFGAWWALGLLLACLWWLVPLLMLSRVSPQFLDFIESARVTTEWSSLTEVLRGTSSWTPFVSTERAAGATLVSDTAAVIATGVLAAAGLAGLAMSRLPFRRRLVAILIVGVIVMCLGFPGALGSPLAEAYRNFLDGAGAPLRNLHKFDPLLRIPLVLGIAHLMAHVRIPVSAQAWRDVNGSSTMQRQLSAALVIVVSAIASGTLAWTGGVAPPGSYSAIPSYWTQTADWLAEQESGPAPARALVVPGAPFADQLWGLTRDEPLQPAATTPWAVRDAIPLTPPGAIRALDSVQRELAAGRGSPGLAATLTAQGVGYLVLRADLDPTTSRSARPLLVAQALRDSPGIAPVATFGPAVTPPAAEGFVVDNGLRPELPAVTVYRVGKDPAGTGPRVTPLEDLARVEGGPESLLAINTARARAGLAPLGPALLGADARRTGVSSPRGSIVTDTPVNRETDFGRVDDHSSAIRSPDDPRLTKNAAPDYPVDGQPLVEARWLLNGEPDKVRVTSSGSAADATQPGQTVPSAAAAAAFDGDPRTAWVSRGLDSAVGQWLALDFAEPVSDLAVTLTTANAIGSAVNAILVTTDAGSAVAQGIEPGKPVRIVLPPGPTKRIEFRAIETVDRTAGNQFALTEVELSNASTGLPIGIRQQTVLPEVSGPVSQWVLGDELGGRSQCVTDVDGRVRCAGALVLDPESPGVFTRTLFVPESVTVTPSVTLRPQPGTALNDLLIAPGQWRADGPSPVTDVRGSAAAAVDGDPRTTWIGPEPAAGKKSRPVTLTVRLPRAVEVSGLRLATPGDYPARPTALTVDLGIGKQKVKVGADGDVALRPARTDTIAITVTDTEDLLDTNDLGFITRAPVGISELTVLTPGGPVKPPAFDDARRIDIPCDSDAAGPFGLGLTAAGRLVRLQVHTTAGALRRGDPVAAPACPGPPLDLREGSQEIAVNPGRAFTVDAVVLDADRPAAGRASGGAQTSAPEIGEWSSTRRTFTVPVSPDARVVSIPESTNPGWTARLGDVALTPIVVDGWQQGWVIPAGMSGTITLSYPLDVPYRWTLLVGLLLVAALFVAACWPRTAHRPAPDERSDEVFVSLGLPLRRLSRATKEPVSKAPPYRDHRLLVALGAVGGLATAWLLTGWWGLAAALVTGIVVARLRRTQRAWTVFGAMFVATLWLAAGPWHSGLPYTGYDVGPQLAALIALAALVASVLSAPPDPAT